MTGPETFYPCCDHCLIDSVGECADGRRHRLPCPEDEDCPGAWPIETSTETEVNHDQA